MIVSFLIYRIGKKFVHIPKELYFKRQHQTNISGIISSSQNVKCLDQFYLLKECIRLNNEIGLPRDETFSRLIYRECGFLLGQRTLRLDKKLRVSIFVLASELCKENYLYDYDLFSKALNSKDYRLWSIATKFKKYES